MLDLGQRLILPQCLCECCTVKLFVGQLPAILSGKGFGLTSRFSKISLDTRIIRSGVEFG